MEYGNVGYEIVHPCVHTWTGKRERNREKNLFLVPFSRPVAVEISRESKGMVKRTLGSSREPKGFGLLVGICIEI